MNAIPGGGLRGGVADDGVVSDPAVRHAGQINAEEGALEPVAVDDAAGRLLHLDRGAILPVARAHVAKDQAAHGDAVRPDGHDLSLAFAVEHRPARSRVHAQPRAPFSPLTIASTPTHDIVTPPAIRRCRSAAAAVAKAINPFPIGLPGPSVRRE